MFGYQAASMASAIMGRSFTGISGGTHESAALAGIYWGIKKEMEKKPPRDTRPSYLEKAHTLPSVSAPYADKKKKSGEENPLYGVARSGKEKDLDYLANTLYKGFSSSSASYGTPGGYAGSGSSSMGYE